MFGMAPVVERMMDNVTEVGRRIMRKGIRLGRIAGVEIDIDYSWLVIFFLFVFLLGYSYFPSVAPSIAVGWYWLAAAVTTVLFFGSVLLHELAHSIVANREGLPVKNITLFLFGGVSQITDEPRTAWDEFRMAIVGPLTSLLIAAIVFGLAWLVRTTAGPLVHAALTYLWYINVALAIFNLLPGFPLDGGRVFRAVLWGATGNLSRSTYIAALVGQGFGWVMILGGAALVFFVRGGYLNGIWLAFIGWFLIRAARSSYQQVVLRTSLSQVPVTSVMNPQVTMLPPDMTVEQLVTEYIQQDESPSAFPIGEEGHLLGVLSLDDVRQVAREHWATKTMRDIMSPLTEEQVLHPNDDAWDAINRMAQTHRDRLLVVEENGQVDGMVTQGAILRWLQTHTRWEAGQA